MTVKQFGALARVILLGCITLGSVSLASAQHGASNDYFGGIEHDEDQLVLELETDDEEEAVEETSPVALHQFLVSYSNRSRRVADSDDDQLDARLVHVNPVYDGVDIHRGTILDMTMEYTVPLGSDIFRQAWLFSARADPAEDLQAKVYNSVTDDSEFIRNWQPFNTSEFSASASIRDNMSMAYWTTDEGEYAGSGDFIINTANLRPGHYRVHGKIFRKDAAGQRIQERNQVFNFTVIDTPIHVAADLPFSVETVSPDNGAMPDWHNVLISDWAVPPIRVRIISDKSDVSFIDGTVYKPRLSVNYFGLIMAFPHKYAESEAKITISVTDGIGRTTQLTYEPWIEAGSGAPEQAPEQTYASVSDTSTYESSNSSSDRSYSYQSSDDDDDDFWNVDDDDDDWDSSDNDSEYEIVSIEESDDDSSSTRQFSDLSDDELSSIMEKPDSYYGFDEDEDDVWASLDEDDDNWDDDVTDFFGDPNDTDAEDEARTNRRSASSSDVKCGVSLSSGGWRLADKGYSSAQYILLGSANSSGVKPQISFDYDCNKMVERRLTGGTSYIIEEYETQYLDDGRVWLSRRTGYADKDVKSFTQKFHADGRRGQRADYRRDGTADISYPDG